MSRDNKVFRDECPARQSTYKKAFTFIEVLAALTIVSISVLALLKLHLISIKMTQTTDITAQAVFLANEKIEELLAFGYPEQGTNYGTLERNGLKWNWQTEVTDLKLPGLNEARITGLRNITVDVTWKQGTGRKNLQVSTYVADRKFSEQ